VSGHGGRPTTGLAPPPGAAYHASAAADRRRTTLDIETLAAIGQNYATYARACDEKRYDLFERVFTPDASLHYRVAGHEFSCRGDTAPAAFAAFLERCYWTHHLIAPPMVEANAEGVFATARVTATHLQRRLEGTQSRWLLRGSYHDHFEHRGGHWRIVRRDCWCLDADGEFLTEGVQHFAALAWVAPDALG